MKIKRDKEVVAPGGAYTTLKSHLVLRIGKLKIANYYSNIGIRITIFKIKE